MSAGGLERQLFSAAIAPNGWIFGKTVRYRPTGGSSEGLDLWVDKGQGAVMINPSEGDFTLQTALEIKREALYSATAVSASISATGEALGNSARWAPNGSTLPRTYWLYDGANLQLFPTWTASTGFGPDGELAYRTSRGEGLGEDAFLRLSGGSVRSLGLSGEDYERPVTGGVFRRTTALELGQGLVIGSNTLRSSLGQDTWVDLGVGAERTNPIGGVYEVQTPQGVRRNSTTFLTKGTARVAGLASRFAPGGADLGSDAWGLVGAAPVILAMTGSPYEVADPNGVFRTTVVSHALPDGRWVVRARRYGATSSDSRGQDVVIHDGISGSVIGLTGGEYEFNPGSVVRRESSVGAFNAAGAVAGVSSRYTSSGGSAGTDAWFWNGSSSVRVNPVGGVFESSGSVPQRIASVRSMNAASQLVGLAAAYSPGGAAIGNAAYFYDPGTATTTPLVFSTAPDGRMFSDPAILTETGFVLGSYTLFDGSVSLGFRAFMWSAGTGFTDLTSVAQGLGLSGFNYLSSVLDVRGTSASGAPITIIGRGQAVGESSAQTAYVLTLIPSPGAGGLLGISGVLALRRRRG